MTATPDMAAPHAARDRRRGRLFFIIIGATTAARILALTLNAYDLGPDETQYWFWSLTPDWGYFSKPPLIAWLIAATTTLFGDSEWAIRLSAPLLHAGTASFLFLLGRSLYGDAEPADAARIAFWGGLIYFFSPGVSFSSNLIATDTPLLFFWSLALLALDRARRDKGWRWPLLLGAALGLGLLAKYAMIYFAIGAAASAIFSAPIRRFLLSRRGAAAAAVMLAILAPNIVWNATHDFATLSHTAANADWGGALFNFGALAKFLLDQLGIIGPLAFPILIWVVIRLARRRDARRPPELFLLAFTLPPLVIVAAQAFISRAHANWAAAAYPAASLLAAAALIRHRQTWLARLGVGAQAAAAFMLAVLLAAPGLTEAVGLAGVAKRITGWEAQGGRIAAIAAQGPYDAIMADDREIIGALLYYVRPRSIPIVAWNMNIAIDNHYERAIPHDRAAQRRVLLVTTFPDAGYLEHEKVVITRIAEDVAPIGGTRGRTLYLFDIQFTE